MTNLAFWPFRAEVAGNIAGGSAAELVVRMGVAPSSPTADHVQIAVNAFVDLASTGGLCGDVLAPSQRGARYAAGPDPTVSGSDFVWRFTSLAIDPRGAAVLFNMLEGAQAAVAFACLSASGRDTVPLRAVDDYPAVTRHVPFPLLLDPEDRRVSVEVTFAQPPPPDLHEEIEKVVYDWALVGMLGGFREAGPMPELPHLIPAQEVELAADTLTHELEKISAHDALFDSLVNMLAWVSATLAPIDEVRIT